jgi:hypothetical protein
VVAGALTALALVPLGDYLYRRFRHLGHDPRRVLSETQARTYSSRS